MISAFGVEHGPVSKSEIGGMGNAWKAGRAARAMKMAGHMGGAEDRQYADETVKAMRHEMRETGSTAERAGFHAGHHAGKYAVGGAAGGGVLVGRKTKQNRAVAPETKGKRR